MSGRDGLYVHKCSRESRLEENLSDPEVVRPKWDDESSTRHQTCYQQVLFVICRAVCLLIIRTNEETRHMYYFVTDEEMKKYDTCISVYDVAKLRNFGIFEVRFQLNNNYLN